MKKLLSVTLFIFFLQIMLLAQNKKEVLNQTILLNPGKYKLIQVIEKLNEIKGISITYDANSLPLEDTIELVKTNPTIQEVLNIVQNTLNVEYQVKGDYIILKKKIKTTKFKVSGMISDSASNESLAGTSVYIKENNYGVISGPEGEYSLKLVPGNYVLVFSFIGYKTEEKSLIVNDDIELNVILRPDKKQIEEVKVTKQRDFWGNMNLGRNISSIESKKIEKINTNNASDILQASVPGVWSSQTSGAPGDHQKIRIRGLSSLFGCSDPLYIIDGVAVPIVNLHSLGIGDLNIYDIEKITVLKDAASTALYGFQGANGVVIIDTKRKNESHVSFSVKYGIQTLPKRYDLMNTKDFLSALDTAKKNCDYRIRKFYPAYSDTLQSTDWQDVIFRDGMLSEYQLSGSGAFGKNNFYLSGNYYSHQGIIKNSSFKRYNFMANIGRNFTKKLSAELNIRSSIQNNFNNLDQYYGNDLIVLGINKSPCLKSTPDTLYYDPPRKPIPGSYYQPANRTFARGETSRTYFGDDLPTEQLINSTRNTLNTSINSANLAVKCLLSNHFFINASSSATFRNNNYKSAYSIIQINNGSTEIYYESKEHYVLLNQQINLNYHQTINNHEFILTSGYRNYADNANWKLDTIGNKYTMSSDENYFLRNSLAFTGHNGSITRFIQSFATHLNYNYKKTYYASFIVNYENLKINDLVNISNWFPSVAVNWDISKEPGLNQLSWLNQLNIFANIGIAGNYPVSAVAGNFYDYCDYSFNDTVIKGKAVAQFANHHLKSELSKEYNTGMNLKLFDNRVLFSVDYYSKINSNLIVMRDIPVYYLSGKMMYNIGKISNQGLEFNLELEPVSNKSFNWYSVFAISFNRQKVIKTGPEKQINFPGGDLLVPDFIVTENQALGYITGYKYLGEWTVKDDTTENIFVFKSGGSKYVKADTSSTTVSVKDKINLGKSIPDYTWHWSNTFSYKNFSLDFVFYGVAGVSKYNGTKAATYMAATNRDITKFMQPLRKTLTDFYFYRSSYFVEDASFIRLKQITFSYLIPRKVLKFGDLRISVSFDNLITITHYSGYDPEASIYTDNSFSDYAVDRGAYPIPRSYYFSIKLDL
jgi:TonB-dependent starch-binding outer membrane protein SusC